MVKSLGCSNNKVTRCRNEHQPKDPSKQSFQKQRFLMKSGKNGQLTGHQLQRNTSCAFSLFSSLFPLSFLFLLSLSVEATLYTHWTHESSTSEAASHLGQLLIPKFVLGLPSQILIYFHLPPHWFQHKSSFILICQLIFRIALSHDLLRKCKLQSMIVEIILQP